MIKALMTCFFLVFSIQINAQLWTSMIDQQENYYDIVKEADRYFAQEGKNDKRGYKAFRRWEEQMSYKVGRTGVLRNFSALNYSVYKKLKKADSRSTHGTWTEVGPFNYTDTTSSQGGIGRVNRLTIDPANAYILWAGTPAGGLWKSTNGGSTWTPYSAGLGPTGMSGVVIDHTNSNIMYMLTGDGERAYSSSIGVLKSTDGGASWGPTGLAFDYEYTETDFWSAPERLYKIIMHPTNPLILYVCGLGGVWKTSNGGSTFAKIYTGVVYDIEFSPDDPEVVYGGGFSSVFKKHPTADTFWPIVYSQDSSFRVEITVSPDDPSAVYALFSHSVKGFGGVVKSDDYGNTGSWTVMSTTPNILSGHGSGADSAHQVYSGNFELLADPDNASILYAAGINLWKSSDSGATWTRKTFWDKADPAPYVHADFIDLIFRDGTLYAVNDGGIYKTSDGADTWLEITSGLSIATFYQIDVQSNKYVGGTQDNGTFSGSVSDPLGVHDYGGDGFGAAYQTTNTNIRYISSQSYIHRIELDDFDNVSPFGLTGNKYWNTRIHMHTAIPEDVFVSSDRQLNLGTGDGDSFSWDSLRTASILTDNIRNYVQGEDNADIMYVTSKTLVIKTENVNANPPTWLPLNITYITEAQPADVEVDPMDAERVWITLDGYEAGEKVYYSYNGGSNWENISGSLPNIPIYSILYQPGSNDGLYIGTELGIYYRNADMSDWIYFSNGLPFTQINDLDTDGSYLYAGTFGRGIWRSSLYSSCPPVLTLTPENDPSTPYTIGKQIMHASNYIHSTRIIQGGIGTEVYYNAGSYIDLKDGFWGKQGNFLNVKVEGCPD